MSASGSNRTDMPEGWRALVHEQLRDYSRLLALGRDLLETLRTYPGPAKLKELGSRRGQVLRSLKDRAKRMDALGLQGSHAGAGGALPENARAQLRRALEAVLEVEEQCRKFHEEHMERLRKGIETLDRGRAAVKIYAADAVASPKRTHHHLNLSG